MSRETTFTEAVLIDYLHRNGDVGTRQALIDYMVEVEGYPLGTIGRVLSEAARDGVIERWQGCGDVMYGVIDDDPYAGE